MDNLTHTLTGAALAKAGFGRRTPLATTTLVIAANAPDVDALAYTQGSYLSLAFRRGITHGVPAMLVLPLVVAAAVLAWDRWVRRRRRPDAEPARPAAVLALSFLGFLTHPVLDWMNTYGMRWWMPFDGRWSYGDTLFILDPWLWLLLGAAVWLGGSWARPAHVAWAALAAALSAMVFTAPVPASARWAWAAGIGVTVLARTSGLADGGVARQRAAAGIFTVAVGYVVVMILTGSVARREVRTAAEAAGIGPVLEVMVAPVPAHPLRGEVVVRTPEGYVRGTHRPGGDPRVVLDREDLLPLRAGAPGLSPEEVETALALAVHERDVRNYLTWSRFPYFRVARVGDRYRVLVADARYDGRGTGSLGGVEVYVSTP